MIEDKRLKKLNEAYANMEAAAAPTNNVNQLQALSDQLKGLVTVTDGELEVEIKLGWKTIATLYEEDGAWYVVMGQQQGVRGHPSKEEALKAVIAYFRDSD